MVYSKNKKFVCVVLAIILIVSAILVPAIKSPIAFATDISDSKAKQSELQKKNDELNSSLKDLKANMADQKAYKETLDAQIAVVEQQITEINTQISALDSEITEKESAIAGIQKDMEKNFATLKQRLKAIYMAGDTSTLDIILGAKDFSDFLDKSEIMKNVSNHDSELISSMQKNMDAIESDKAKVVEARKTVSDQKTELDSKQTELSSLLEESKKVIQELEGKERTVLGIIDENDSEMQKIEAEIKDYYAKQQAAQQSSGSSSGSSSGGGNINPSGQGYAWPVPGFYYISSNYYDTWDRPSMHRAIDIAGGGIFGQPVVAANDGVVMGGSSSGWNGGAGIYLWIDHGDGRSTFYYHMSRLAVSVGSRVSKGQTIGNVGSTGNSTGPHLHFETRKNGEKYDPMTEY